MHRSLTAGALVMVLISLFWVFHAQFNAYARAEDDQMSFYVNALALQHPSVYEADSARVMNFLGGAPRNANCNCLWEQFRFKLRHDFRNHDFLYHILLSKVNEWWAPLRAETSYPVFVSIVILSASHLLYGAALACLAFIFLGWIRSDLVAALAVSIAAMLTLDLFSPIHPSFWILRVRPSDLSGVLESLKNAFFLLLSPSAPLTGWFPRSAFALLLLGVFGLRWSGRPGMAYFVLALLTPLHEGSGILAFGALLLTDLLLRPSILRKPSVAAGVASNLAVALMPNALVGSITGIHPMLILALLAGGLGVASITWAIWRHMGWIRGLVLKLRSLPARLGEVGAELALLAGLWFVITPLAMLMYIVVGQPEAIYTWGDLPARYLMLMRGPLFLGLAYLAIFRYRSPELVRGGIALAAGAICLAVAWQTTAHFPDRLLLPASAQTLEDAVIRAPNVQPVPYDEATMYYAMAKSMESGSDFMEPLLKR